MSWVLPMNGTRGGGREGGDGGIRRGTVKWDGRWVEE